MELNWVNFNNFFIFKRIIAETTTGCLLAGSALGRKGVPSEEVAKEAVESLLEDLRNEACLDTYAQDQVFHFVFKLSLIQLIDCFFFQFILFMALANGHSKVKVGAVTLHTQTAVYITELLTGVTFFLFCFL